MLEVKWRCRRHRREDDVRCQEYEFQLPVTGIYDLHSLRRLSFSYAEESSPQRLRDCCYQRWH